MIDLRRILVPIDFSKHSEHALTYAVGFAEKFGSDIYLFHVSQDLAVFFPEAVAPGDPTLPTSDRLVASVRDALDRLRSEKHLERFRVHVEARHGTPYHEIVAYAREQEIDLIIMGTHGRTGLSHLLVG